MSELIHTLATDLGVAFVPFVFAVLGYAFLLALIVGGALLSIFTDRYY